MATAPAAAPLRIGLIADIQYADADDGTDFDGKEHRHFRNALRIAEAAVDCWNAFNVDYVVQLGDIIDGCNSKLGATESAMRTVIRALERSTAKRRFDLVGNHELYNVARSDLPGSGLRCSDDGGRFYYSAHLGGCWEAVFLDAYEYALIGKDRDSPNFAKAEEVMRANNPKVLDPSGSDWFEGLPVERHRFVPYNGGMSATQVAWLDRALAAAEAEHRRVLLFSHVPLYQPATKAQTVVWNCEEVLAVLHAHRESVVAVFAGHDHDGGYAMDPEGLHHVTMSSPLTAAPGTDCFAILECHDDGWAHFFAHGRACVESNSGGRGRAYHDLVLAKGVENRPAGDAAAAPPERPDAAAMRAARIAALDC
mmetsp:Transcript_63428/g.178506  ORF Transcript_63428/g.178506 Transcript_63428/m.178506 type:complete len:367 (+) Transcript_63428:89-1189(+)